MTLIQGNTISFISSDIIYGQKTLNVSKTYYNCIFHMVNKNHCYAKMDINFSNLCIKKSGLDIL